MISAIVFAECHSQAAYRSYPSITTLGSDCACRFSASSSSRAYQQLPIKDKSLKVHPPFPRTWVSRCHDIFSGSHHSPMISTDSDRTETHVAVAIYTCVMPTKQNLKTSLLPKSILIETDFETCKTERESSSGRSYYR